MEWVQRAMHPENSKTSSLRYQGLNKGKLTNPKGLEFRRETVI